MELPVKVLWTPSGSEESSETRTRKVLFTLARSRENSAQERDQQTSFLVAQRWHAQVLREAMDLNRIGRFREASDFITNQLRHFERYCRGIQGTGQLVQELKGVVRCSRTKIETRNGFFKMPPMKRVMGLE